MGLFQLEIGLAYGICGTFHIKSYYFGPVMPKTLKKF